MKRFFNKHTKKQPTPKCFMFCLTTGPNVADYFKGNYNKDMQADYSILKKIYSSENMLISENKEFSLSGLDRKSMYIFDLDVDILEAKKSIINGNFHNCIIQARNFLGVLQSKENSKWHVKTIKNDSYDVHANITDKNNQKVPPLF